MKSKIKKEESERIKRERAERALLLEGRRRQAETLQGFVGFPLKFCMAALEKHNDNIELAAEWAIGHYESYVLEHPEVLEEEPNEDDDSQPESDSESSLASSSGSSSSLTSSSGGNNNNSNNSNNNNNNNNNNDPDQFNWDHSSFNVGYSYSLSRYDKEDKTSRDQSNSSRGSNALSYYLGREGRKDKIVQLDNLHIGQQLIVSTELGHTPSLRGRNWVEPMSYCVGKTGIVKAIDKLFMMALLQFYHEDRYKSEEWWFPIRTLQLPERNRIDPFNGGLIINWNTRVLREWLAATSKTLSQYHLTRAALSLEEITSDEEIEPQPQQQQQEKNNNNTIATAESPAIQELFQLLRLAAKQYLSSPIPEFMPTSKSSPPSFLSKLSNKISRICKQKGTSLDQSLVESILQQAYDMLHSSCEYITKSSVVEESRHPYYNSTNSNSSNSSSSTINEPKKFKFEGASGLCITFDKKCKIGSRDVLLFYADKECTQLYQQVTNVVVMIMICC